MIYTSGKTLLTREQLSKIEVPVRTNVSKQWQGIQHGFLANTIVDQISEAGLEIMGETWYTNPLGDTLWGAVDIAPESASPSLSIGQAANFSLGVRHSNLGRYAVSFAVGARITVCSNGLFAGDFVLKRKHSAKVDLKAAIDEGVAKYLTGCIKLEDMIQTWQGQSLSDRDAALIILEARQKEAISVKSIDPVFHNWQNPPHAEFEPRTAWSLYNAFTEEAKNLTPPVQMKMLTGMRDLFNREFGTEELVLES